LNYRCLGIHATTLANIALLGLWIMRYLVTGGAGFVGSHVVLCLLDAGHEVTVLDDLSTGHRAAVPAAAQFRQVDLRDRVATEAVLAEGPWDGVLHFAALSVVADSMREPFRYLRDNYLTSLNLIEACVGHGVTKLVFSSTAALFGGETRFSAIDEAAAVEPGSPYGESKFLIERALLWAERCHGLRSACLRYFNAAGADPGGRAGEDHRPETHMIPLTIDTLLGRRAELKIFGNDFQTPDGSCVRDYVHVTDVAQAHILALKALDTGSVTYNIGNGRGYSNYDVVRSVERVAGRALNWSWAPRRAGDPAVLVADSTRLRRETGWLPKFAELDQIVETALRWRVDHPHGYQG